MSVFDRMGRVLQSNLNALFDKVEDDRKLISLNLEEMADQLKRGRQDLVAAVAAEKQLRNKVETLKGEGDSWDRRAELALRSGDEALAREALKHKLRVQKELGHAESARVEQRDVALRMKSELERMEQRLEELRLRKNTLVARAQQARSGGEEALGTRGGSNAFANFRALEERIEGREQQNAAMAEVEAALGTHDARDLEAKFRALEADLGGSTGSASLEVEDELSALKKRIRL